MAVNHWTRDELLLTFNLYCRTPFGKLHRSNPEIISLARSIGRTPSAVAMKLVNFASFDPVQQERQIKGLRNASRADRDIWDEFNANPEELAFESQQVLLQLSSEARDGIVEPKSLFPTSLTESTRLIRTRLVQSFFRDAVLSSYEFKCAFCSLDLPELLNASHIIPWSQNVERRADPRNGLSLCAIHDRAFDRGLLSVGESFEILLATRARLHSSESRLYLVALLEIESKVLSWPKRFAPDSEALAYHREHIFER
jgi:predicted restriction endonuclease